MFADLQSRTSPGAVPRRIRMLLAADGGAGDANASPVPEQRERQDQVPGTDVHRVRRHQLRQTLRNFGLQRVQRVFQAQRTTETDIQVGGRGFGRRWLGVAARKFEIYPPPRQPI